MNERVQKVLEGLRTGKITREEADAYLRAVEHITLASVEPISPPPPIAISPPEKIVPESSRKPLEMTLIITTGVLLMMIAGLFIYSDTLAGLSITDITQEGVTNTTIPFNQTVTSLRVSGTLIGEGEATFFLDTGTSSLIIGTVSSDPGTPRTDKAGYLEGEPVDVEHAPADANYYLDEGATTTVVQLPFPAPAQDAELLIVVGGDAPTTYRLPVLIGERERQTTFTDLCVDTCSMEPVLGTVIAQVTGDARLDFNLHAEDTLPNRAPELTAPFDPITLSSPITLDLGAHFTDADGQSLLYSTGGDAPVDAQISGSILTLTPLTVGSGTLLIYASDLQELVQAELVVSVPAAPEMNATQGTNETLELNETSGNATEQPINEAPVNETAANATDGTTSDQVPVTTLDCSDPNPNLRPVECLQQDAGEYLSGQDIYLENLDRTHVAKLNELGNLLITGNVIMYSVGAPGARDFRIGLPDRDGNVDVVAWVDSTGNLHLRGMLYEEQVNLAPPPGSYSILTTRSIYLAYVDMTTGDMYLRGNVIPYRREI